MINIQIENKKTFTSKLFLKEDFDIFLLKEAVITTFNTYTIDGRIQKKFYTDKEYDAIGKPEFSRWKDMKKICFEMIKGNRLPLKFKLVLKLEREQVMKILSDVNTTLTEEDIQGLYINIKYENDEIDCITATSLNVFSMDKTLEEAFDKYMERFLLGME